jgi:site-specific DNA recombinase
MTEKLNLIGYIRVSTIKQLEGHSLDNQKESIEKYCKANNHNLEEIYKDKGISAFKDRPEFNAAMKELANNENIHGVVVNDLTRFGRSTVDLLTNIATIKEKGKTFISLKENIDLSNTMGKFLLTVLSAIAEYERDIIKERMESGKEYAKIHGTKSGKPMHRPPKNIDWDKVRFYREKGISWTKIAEIVGTTPPTLIKHARLKGLMTDS